MKKIVFNLKRLWYDKIASGEKIVEYRKVNAFWIKRLVDCAMKAGFVQKNKIVGVWQGECDICHKQKPCTDLWHDWNPPKTKREVK